MNIIIRAYDKDTHQLIDNIQKDNLNNPFPTLDGYTRDPRFEINLRSDLQDKNGNYIFESDILQIDENWKSSMNIQNIFVLVGFKNGCFMFGSSDNPEEMNMLLTQTAPHCVVIGNKYQNYNLIKPVEIRKKRKIKHRSKSKTKRIVSK